MIRHLTLLRSCILLLIGILSGPTVTFAQHPVALAQSTLSPPETKPQQERIPLVDLLKTWEKDYSVNFGYADQDVVGKYVTTPTDEKTTLKGQLERVLPPLKLRYRELNRGFYVIHRQEAAPAIPRLPKNTVSTEPQSYVAPPVPQMTSAAPQEAPIEQTVSGQVTDLSTNEPLPGVNVLAKGTSTGTVTDVDGNYRLTVDDEVTTLVFSSIGFESVEEAINGRGTISLALAPDIQSLEEVVVVGYGTQQKSDLTASVASISSEDFESQPITSLDQAIQGRSAGVIVNNNSGAPGAGAKVRIRGINSISGDNNPLYVVDGIIGVDFQNVNPNDVESIEILKDASATAIYGSRGANGVVLITTKKAREEGVTVSFNSFYGVKDQLKSIDLIQAADFARLVNRVQTQQDSPIAYSEEDIATLERTGGTNWQDELFRRGSVQNYQLSIGGKTDRTNYYISGNFVDEKGIIRNSDFKRYSLLTNISTEISDRIRFDLQLAATRREAHNSGSPATIYAATYDPTQPVYNADGTFNANAGFGNQADGVGNPVGMQLLRNEDDLINNGRVNAGITIQIIEGLSFNTLASVSADNRKINEFNDVRQILNNPADARVTAQEAFTFQNTNALTYNKRVGSHAIQLTGVFEQQRFRREGVTARSNQIESPIDGYHNLGVGQTQQTTSDYTNWALRSYIGRLNYTLLDRYLLSASFRADGTSRFYEDNRWGYFPSVALAWRLSDEGFMSGIDPISHLKLRASWGVTGSQAVSAYSALPLLSFDPNWAYPIGGPESTPVTGALLARSDATNRLKWEETQQTSAGLDAEFFAGRLSFEFDYYLKQTDDLLLNFSLPDYAGGLGTVLNVGKMENQGFDLLIGGWPVQTNTFRWESSFNISAFSNQVVDIGDNEQIFAGGNAFSGGGNYVVRVGEELGSIVAYKFLGVYSSEDADEAAEYNRSPGDAKYLDANQDGGITPDDVVIVGRALPDFTLGFNNTFYYQNFELNLFWQGSLGNDVLNTQQLEMRIVPIVPVDPNILNAWEAGTNENTDVPALNGFTQARSSYYVEDGSYLRLKNIRLAYNLPEALLNSWKIEGLQLYASAQNLVTFTKYSGYDPEASSSSTNDDRIFGYDRGVYPNARILTAGLSLTF